MYRYDEFDHKLVTERVAQFRRQVNAVWQVSSRKISSSPCG